MLHSYYAVSFGSPILFAMSHLFVMMRVASPHPTHHFSPVERKHTQTHTALSSPPVWTFDALMPFHTDGETERETCAYVCASSSSSSSSHCQNPLQLCGLILNVAFRIGQELSDRHPFASRKFCIIWAAMVWLHFHSTDRHHFAFCLVCSVLLGVTLTA
jgi:hypothetical protein